MYSRELIKPDGRRLTLYSRRPIATGLTAPSPVASRQECNPHLRWHPLRGEWVAYAAYRQDRTFLPPAGFNPLAAQTDPQRPTELPAGDYDVAVLDNLFPVLSPAAHDPPRTSLPSRRMAAVKSWCSLRTPARHWERCRSITLNSCSRSGGTGP